MSTTTLPPTAAAAVRLRYRRDVDDVDFRRALAALALEGHPQARMAAWLGISQPAVSQLLKTARATSAPRSGFSGASPMELCERYAAGLLSRAELVDELTRWEYPAEADGDPWDDLAMRPEGGFQEVTRALGRGLIDAELYDEVLDAVAQD